MRRVLKFAAMLAAVVVTGVCVTVAVTIAGVVRDVANAAEPPACAPVGYMLEIPSGLPGWWLRDVAVREAVGMLESATGQPYRFDGYTDWTPTTATIDDAPDDLVIDVDTPNALDLLRVEPGHAGYTIWTPTHAVVAIDALALEGMPTGLDFAGPGRSIFTLAEHELGHSRGLPDSTDVTSLMDPNLTAGPFYSAADRAHLAATGCRP